MNAAFPSPRLVRAAPWEPYVCPLGTLWPPLGSPAAVPRDPCGCPVLTKHGLLWAGAYQRLCWHWVAWLRWVAPQDQAHFFPVPDSVSICPGWCSLLNSFVSLQSPRVLGIKEGFPRPGARQLECCPWRKDREAVYILGSNTGSPSTPSTPWAVVPSLLTPRASGPCCGLLEAPVVPA